MTPGVDDRRADRAGSGIDEADDLDAELVPPPSSAFPSPPSNQRMSHATAPRRT